MKDIETGGVWAMLIAALTVLGKWKMFQSFGEKLLTRWVEGRPSRHLTRRLSDPELASVLSQEKAEMDTLAMLIQAELSADRVTVVEYDCPKDPAKPRLATCIVEEREPRIVSIRHELQRTPLASEVWQEVERVFYSPSRYLFIQDVRRLENSVLRAQLLRYGVRSAYYQALPATAGHCGAMLSVSWCTEVNLSEEDLAGLHWSGRCLGALQRTLWAFQPAAA